MPRQKEKSETVVTISGKNYTLLGYESDEYMQRVASYVNSRLEEYRREDSYRRLPADTQNVLVLLNIADEYFKSRVQLEQLTEDLEKRDKDLYDVKHRLVQAASKLEALEATMQEMKDDMAEKDKKIVKLETELAHSSGERASHPAKGSARKA
ncbi:MAG: cell division protein ZapA [Lachnospiraceae bacterium]|nr:cell division protein ZapA [Lachnospiraceae bacterium]